MERCLSWLVLASLALWGAIAQAQESVRIVAIYPLTGTLASGLSDAPAGGLSDAPAPNGYRLAVDELNENGGLLGRRVELVALDSGSTPLGARAAAKAAVAMRPLAVLGESVSSLSLAMAPVLQQAKVIMISPLSTHPDVTLVGDYVFRMCFLDSQQGLAMADFARDRLKASSAVILTNVSMKYSEELSRHFAARFRERGGTVLLRGEYVQDAADFTAMLDKVKVQHPDVIFIPGYKKDSGVIMRQARAKDIKGVFLGGDGWGREAKLYAGTAINGGFSVAHWHAGDPSPISKAFAARHEKRYGPPGQLSTALGYDAVYVLADAVRRANAFDPVRIRDELARTKDLEGVTGRISFDRDRNPRKSVIIVRHDQGHTHYVDSIMP